MNVAYLCIYLCIYVSMYVSIYLYNKLMFPIFILNVYMWLYVIIYDFKCDFMWLYVTSCDTVTLCDFMRLHFPKIKDFTFFRFSLQIHIIFFQFWIIKSH